MARSTSPPSISAKPPVRILVVDDEPGSRSALLRLLEQNGYSADGAEDGAAALRMASERRPDVVITDLYMPGMDGVELLVKLKEQSRDMLVIVVTSFGDVGSAVAAMRAGAEDYLSKPLDLDALELVLERALERRDLRLESENMRRRIAVQHERLNHLYKISKELTRFENIARTLPEVLALLSETLPLRTAILLVAQGAEPEKRTRAIAWHADAVSPPQLLEAKAHAKSAYAYLVRRASQVEEEAGANLLPSSVPPPPGARKSGYVLLPLVVDHRQIFGALQIEGAVGLDEADLTFLNAVVNQLAVALDRVVAIESKQRAAKAELRVAEFLAGASATLFSSLQYENTIAAVVQAAVPPFAETCFLDRVGEDDRLHRVAIQLADPASSNADRARQSEPAPASIGAQAEAFRSGKSVLLTDLDAATDERVPAGTLKESGIQSMMAVALTARGRRIGVLTFVAESGRRYSATDLALAEEIGRRAAIAIDNAELYEQAQRAIRSRQDLLAMVSHDLKNPLNAILMATILLTKGNTEEDAGRKKWIDMIERSAHRMHRLLADLLDVASIEAGHLAVSTQGHPVGPLVSDAIDLHRVAAEQQGVRLEQVLVGAELEVECDRDRVLQVFGNLIGNAIKFTPEGGSIAVRAEPRGQEAVFSVADSGPGIEPKDLSNVFGRFWQSKKTARLGTGLGLAIAKGLVEAQGGRIWAESTVGKGATFFFTLPVVAASAGLVQGDSPKGSIPQRRTEWERNVVPTPDAEPYEVISRRSGLTD